MTKWDSRQTESAELNKALKPNGNFNKPSTDSQHAALEIVSDCLSRYLNDGDLQKGKGGLSPYTGHSAYVVLSYVQTAIVFPDVEIYQGQRKAALND